MYPEGRGPFYNQLSAAAYCGYSTDHFRRLAKKYNLKPVGPNGTRYARADLDEFMMNPTKFKPETNPKGRTPLKLEV